MICIYCGHKTSTTNSRSSLKQLATWRRHRCTRCNAEFTTYESANLETTHRVLKQSGATEPFYKEKLYYSIVRALEHRQKAAIEASALAQTVISQLLALHNPLIASSAIYQLTSQALANFDQAAHVRFTAFHSRISR